MSIETVTFLKFFIQLYSQKRYSEIYSKIELNDFSIHSIVKGNYNIIFQL